MGPSQSKSKSTPDIIEYLRRDPRLVQQFVSTPQLFSGIIDVEIKRVENLRQSLPLHPLETQIIDGINDRFNASFDPFLNQFLNNDQFYELQTFQQFLELLIKIQNWYHVEQELSSIIAKKQKNSKITIRKRVQATYESKLDKLLFSKVFIEYYLLLLKKANGGKDEAMRNYVNSFHKQIGRMICQMINYDHLNEKKIEQLCYLAVSIDKTKSKEKVYRILMEIRGEFWPIYLTKEHSLNVDSTIYNRMKQVSRCYLDELYIRSIKEAEDPDIVVEGNEGLGMIKYFPIVKVKNKKK